MSRHVNYLTLTYVEDRERVEHLASMLLKCQQRVCWIIHDKDTLKDGTPDKPHCHCVIHLDYAMSVTAFSQNFAIRDRMVRPCKKGDEIEDLDGALLYLIHADRKSRSEGKFQYNPSLIRGPMASYARERIVELFNRSKDSHQKEADSFLEIQCFIESSLHLSMTELSRWAAQNGHWACFRRSSSIIRDILREHNDYLAQLAIVKERQEYETQLRINNDKDVLYKELGVRALRTLNTLLHEAGRPSLKLLDDIEKGERALEQFKETKRKAVDMELLKSI